MTRRGRIKLGLSIGIPVLAIILLIIFWNWNWFIPIVESQASAQLGRRVTLSMAVEVEIGRWPKESARKANSSEPHSRAASLSRSLSERGATGIE